jgi:hypothetical protein
MIHTRTKIIALISLGLFLLSGGAYVGLFLLVQNHKENLEEERVRAAEVEMQTRALQALEATVAASQSDREKLEGYILSENATIDFVERVERIAKEEGVALLTNSLSEASIDDSFDELTAGVTVTGPFDRVMRMLRILETLPEQSWIREVVLTKSEEAGENFWSAQITLRVSKFKKI